MRQTRWIERARSGVLALAGVLLLASPALADQWNDKTTLTFSEPVAVPGATLQPGTYTFKLLNPDTRRHMVQIEDEKGNAVAVVHAVPMKRTEAIGDTILKFAPTDAGKPPALRGWYYPGSLYGHEFIYSDEEARSIAERTKTIVLSVDLKGTDAEAGAIRVYQPSGQMVEWHGDAGVLGEWDEWRKNRPATAAQRTAAGRHEVDKEATDKEERRKATAPMVEADRRAARVKVDELEDNPKKFIGRTISVDGEVEDIFGPRLFTIDEPTWGDLEGETLVYIPSAAAVLVREDDRVTVEGTVKAFVRDDLKSEWGWPGEDIEANFERTGKPVLVASRVIGGDNDTAIVIDMKSRQAEATPVGTSGRTGAAVSNLSDIESADERIVGRQVNLTGLRVSNLGGDGFFIKGEKGAIFVLPANSAAVQVKAGDTIAIDGYVLQMPGRMDQRLNAPSDANPDIYIFATKVEESKK